MGHLIKLCHLVCEGLGAVSNCLGRSDFKVSNHTSGTDTRDLNATGRDLQQQSDVRDESGGKELVKGHRHLNRDCRDWHHNKTIELPRSPSNCHSQHSLLRISDIRAGRVVEGRVQLLRRDMNEVVKSVVADVDIDDLRVADEEL